jgi:endonuclease G, mitochondrial
MLISRELLEASERDFRKASFDPTKLKRTLGDGPIDLSAEDKRHRYQQVLGEVGTVERANVVLERIIQGNDLVGINYLAKGTQAARPVCRIQLRDAGGNVIGFGSGFLVAPGVLLTNHHVFATGLESRHSVADFDFELDVRGQDRPAVHFGFDPNRFFYANKELDFALVAVQPRSIDGARELKDWGWLPLDGRSGKSDVGEYLTIVQHPSGERKQVVVRENKLLKFDGDVIWYATDTVGGSSGAPVFNRFWQVVALHHSGVPKKDAKGRWLTVDGRVWDESMDERLIDWIANEGIRVSSIVRHLNLELGSNAFVKLVLESGLSEPPIEEATRGPRGAAHASQTEPWFEQSGDRVSLVVPVRLPVDVIKLPGGIAPPAAPPAASPADSGRLLDQRPADSLPVEAVKINQKTLGSRPGYKSNFLGTGKLTVPLPTLPTALQAKTAKLKGKSSSELKYFNYSVVINAERGFAFFSAVNIDGRLRQDVGKREGDTWLRDPRIAEDAQVGNDFYGNQKTFEADRSKNPFDRGHLVRRLDATWGKNVAQAKQHGDDTFHFTNAVPQFFKFNQGKKLWLGLEEFVLDQLEADERKACVFNGPVFDGPLAPDGGDLPDPSAPAKEDPTFGGVSIPKFFWKLMVLRQGQRLFATAFLLSQQDQILSIDRIHELAVMEKLTEAEAKVFQISIGDLAKLTKLKFGDLVSVDTKEALQTKPRRLHSFEDIRI